MHFTTNEQTRSLIAMGLFAFLFGCGKGAPPNPALPEITAETEEGFVDLVFAISEAKISTDGSVSFHAQGLYKGETVGLCVLLQSPWKQGTLGDVMTTFQGRVFFQRSGAESDLLMRIMGTLYQASIRPQSMRKDNVLFTAISLEGDPRTPDAGPLKMKLFIESEDEERCAELYTNVDVQRRRLEIREKDPAYRDPVMRAIGSE